MKYVELPGMNRDEVSKAKRLAWRGVRREAETLTKRSMMAKALMQAFDEADTHEAKMLRIRLGLDFNDMSETRRL